MTKKKPNIIIITLDTVRKDAIGIYGGKGITPNIDKIAEKGVVFNRAYTQCNTTLPSHSSILTGLYPFNHGSRTNYQGMGKEVLNIPQFLKKKGYATGAFLSMTMEGLERGFDVFDTKFGSPINRVKLLNKVYNRAKKFLIKYNFMNSVQTAGISKIFKNKTEKLYTREAKDTTIASKEWIKKKRDKQKPVFMWVHYLDAHVPYAPPEKFLKMHSKDGFKDNNKQNLYDMLNFLPCHKKLMKRWLKDIQSIEYVKAMYRAEVSYIDFWFGELVKSLKEEDLWENSMVYILADHGESFLREYSFYHDTMYEEVINIPFIVKYPGKFKELLVSDLIVGAIDIAPTIVNGVDSAGDIKFDGMDITEILERKNKKRMIYTESYGTKRFHPVGIEEKMRSVIGEKWKIIAVPNTEKTYKFELYDLESEQCEENNLFNERAEHAKTMIDILNEYLKKDKQVAVKANDFSKDKDVIERLKRLGYID